MRRRVRKPQEASAAREVPEGAGEPESPSKSRQRVAVTARRLLTAEGALWDQPWEDHGEEAIRGAIVRLRPPRAGAEAEAVRGELLRRGAAAVRIVPAGRKPAVVVERERRPVESVRQVVLRMVAEANTRDRDALHEAVERALAKAGI